VAVLAEAPAEPASSKPAAREDRRLLLRYHRHGDGRAREELVARFLPLARQLARRYQRGPEPLDDLFQVASLGLVKAIDRFDPDRTTAFSSYAVPTMVGELKRYFRDFGWAVHVPRGMQERTVAVQSTVTRLSKELGRSPAPAEVAESLEITEEQVLEALEAALAYDALSLEAPRPGAEDAGEGAFGDTIGEEDERYELVELGVTIAPQLRALPERERRILRMRFVDDMTQSEIASHIGVSQMHVSRLIRRSLSLTAAGVEEKSLHPSGDPRPHLATLEGGSEGSAVLKGRRGCS
jgi:RNA polymerase sigma-B factor